MLLFRLSCTARLIFLKLHEHSSDCGNKVPKQWFSGNCDLWSTHFTSISSTLDLYKVYTGYHPVMQDVQLVGYYVVTNWRRKFKTFLRFLQPTLLNWYINMWLWCSNCSCIIVCDYFGNIIGKFFSSSWQGFGH